MLSRKKCSTCKRVFGLNNFYKNKSNRDGLAHQCRSCCKSYGKKSRKKHRPVLKIKLQECILELIKEGCRSCGEKDPAALQFDHKNPRFKRNNISDILSKVYSLKYLKEELKKCTILCCNCHKLKTSKQQSWYLSRWYKLYLQGKSINLDECR